MKHQLPAFLAGVAVTAMVFTCAPAIAAQIQTITASANTVNIALNGKQVAAKGENYTLSNGTQVPYSLSYSGTTYLPIRKVGELVGQDIYWDAKTGTAGIGVNPAKTPDKLATDYSTWTAEEEKAYQEFKGMWEVEEYERTTSNEILYNVVYLGNLDKEKFIAYWSNRDAKQIEKYAEMMSTEAQEEHKEYAVAYYFYFKDVSLGYSFAYPARYALSSFLLNPFNIHG